MSTHYDILGLPRTATQEQIQAQYRALAKVVHPDMGGDAVMFAVLDESYDVLRDPVRRAAYDASLLPADRASSTHAVAPADGDTGGVSWGLDESTPAERAMGAELAKQGIASWHQTPDQFLRGLARRSLWLVAYLVIFVAMRACR